MNTPPAALRRLQSAVSEIWTEYQQRTGRFFGGLSSDEPQPDNAQAAARELRENALFHHVIVRFSEFAIRRFKQEVRSLLKMSGRQSLELTTTANRIVMEILGYFRDPDFVPAGLYEIISQERFSLPGIRDATPQPQPYSPGLAGHMECALDRIQPDLDFVVPLTQEQVRRQRRKTLTPEQMKLGEYRQRILGPAWKRHKKATGKSKTQTLIQLRIAYSTYDEFEKGVVLHPRDPHFLPKLTKELRIPISRLQSKRPLP